MPRFWLVLTLTGAVASSAQAALPEPREVKITNWQVDCRPGDDEFSVGCQAVGRRGGVTVRLSTGDSQLFASVQVSGCVEIEYESWWRDQIAGKRDRQALIARALNRRLRQAAPACPAARGTRLTFAWLPDIANVGDPPPKWARMHGKPK